MSLMSTVFRKWMGSRSAKVACRSYKRALQRREHAICGKPFRDATLSAIYGLVLLIKGTTIKFRKVPCVGTLNVAVCAIMGLIRGSL